MSLSSIWDFLRGRGLQSSLRLLSDDFHAPGDTVRAVLQTNQRLQETHAVLQLSREDDDRVMRTSPAAVGPPERIPDGWRCTVSAVLPDDAQPDFEGEWAVAVEARTENGGGLSESAPLMLRAFYLTAIFAEA